MKITINSNKSIKKLNNFWNNIQFHPTDGIEDMWGKFILDNVAKDKIAQYIRIFTMFEDIVSRDESGRLIYDYSLADQRIDYMVEKGFKLLICFNFMPPCIAKNPHLMSELKRYKYKSINYSQPADYNEWAEICFDFTNHVIERYGIDTVKNWYFHCWNEPDGGYWLNSKSNDDYDAGGYTDKIDEYIKLYDYFEYGVSKASDKIRVGGPSAAGSDKFIETFVKHTKEGTNSVSGKIGTRIDFFSIHIYSQGIYSNLPNKSYISPENIIQRLHTLHSIFAKYNYSEKEVLLDEWGAAGGGFIGTDRDANMIFRETEYYPAFFAKLIDMIIRDDSINLSKMMICLSGQHESYRDFDGFRSFFTLSNFKKPIYNGFALTEKLGDNLLLSKVDGENKYFGLIPTSDENGNYKILLYYMCDEIMKKIDTIRIKLNIEGITGIYALRHYRIDENTSNSYGKWCKLGKPATINRSEKEEIMQNGELSLLYPQENITINEVYAEDIIMTKNSVSLIELIKIGE